MTDTPITLKALLAPLLPLFNSIRHFGIDIDVDTDQWRTPAELALGLCVEYQELPGVFSPEGRAALEAIQKRLILAQERFKAAREEKIRLESNAQKRALYALMAQFPNLGHATLHQRAYTRHSFPAGLSMSYYLKEPRTYAIESYNEEQGTVRIQVGSQRVKRGLNIVEFKYKAKFDIDPRDICSIYRPLSDELEKVKFDDDQET